MIKNVYLIIIARVHMLISCKFEGFEETCAHLYSKITWLYALRFYIFLCKIFSTIFETETILKL